MKRDSLRYVTPAVIIALFSLSLAMRPVAAQQFSVGGTFIADLASEPTTIDPLSVSWNAGFVGAQLFNSLLSYDENLKPQLALATKWSITPTDGTYSFELRKGVRWHDGKPFTAEDVKFSFEQIISKFGVFGSAYFKDVKVEIKGDTVVVKPGKFLPGIQVGLFASTDTVIYPKHILEGADFLKSTFRTTDPIGTGPFKMKTWVKGSYMELVRNDDYWNKPKPYLEKIVIKFVKEPAGIIAGLQRGELHYIFRGVPFEAYSTLKATEILKVVPYPRPPYVSAIWFNLGAKYLSDINVRKAIAYSLDREDIAAKATLGLSKPIQYMIDPAVVPPSPTLTIYKYDTAKANSILDAAGYKKGPDGIRFKLELMTRTGEPDEQLWATIVKDRLKDIGIDVSIKTVDFATFLALQTKFQYEMATIKYWISSIWTYQLFSTEWIGKGAFTNNFNYSNPKVDALFDQWLKESDPEKQVKLLQQVEDFVSQDLPEIVLYEVVWLNVLNTDFKGPDIPVGKWVFFDSLENTYSAKTQPAVTTPAPAKTVTVTQTFTQTVAAPAPTVAQPAADMTTVAAAMVAGIVIGALATVGLQRLRRSKSSG